MMQNTLPGADTGYGYGETPFTTPMSIPRRTDSVSSGGYGAGGSPYGAAAMPIPGSGSAYDGAGSYGAGGLSYGAANIPGTGTSPYGQSYGSGMPGGASPLMGATQYAQPVGSAYPGGYQTGFPSGNAAQMAYGRSSPNPYGATGMSMQPQQMPYTGVQATYGGAGISQAYPGVQVVYPDQQQQQQQAYANQSGGPTTTIVAGGRAIPAPAGSTIVIDTSRRSRRASHSDPKYERSHHRSRSIDPPRRERQYVVTAR